MAFRRRQGQGGQRGSVTAEAAVALPSLLLVFAAAVWGVQAAGARVACIDAARAGARAAARGEPLAAVRSVAVRAAPQEADISVRRDTQRVTVRVVARIRPGGRLLSMFPALVVRARAVAAPESSAGSRTPPTRTVPGPPPRSTP